MLILEGQNNLSLKDISGFYLISNLQEKNMSRKPKKVIVPRHLRPMYDSPIIIPFCGIHSYCNRRGSTGECLSCIHDRDQKERLEFFSKYPNSDTQALNYLYARGML